MAGLLERAIAWVSPSMALQRATARLKLVGVEKARQAYDGATVGRRSTGWRVVSSDADAEASEGATRLREVARDMERNNPHAWRIKHAIVTNTVAGGITPSVPDDDITKVDKIKLEKAMRDHFDTTACDNEGRFDLYGLQALVLATVIVSGECLVRIRRRRASDKLPLPFQLQVIEPDFLDSSVDGELPNGNLAIRGIEFNKYGRRVAYHLFTKHPGSIAGGFSLPKTYRVSADTVLHIYRVDRPGQQRGVSWFAPVVLRLRDYADCSDAYLMRQKIAACFAAFITREGGADDREDKNVIEELGPGLIQRLEDGESVTFGTPPQVAGYEEYTKTVLREIAAGMGLSYEAMTGDLSNVNFSSGRMGWLEFQRSIDSWRKHMLVPQLCAPIGKVFVESYNLVNGTNHDFTVVWTDPRREMINPTEEVKSSIAAIRGGLSSLSLERRKLGLDPDVLDLEIQADNQRADAYGLIFDSDGRRTTGNGQIQNASTNDADDKSNK